MFHATTISIFEKVSVSLRWFSVGFPMISMSSAMGLSMKFQPWQLWKTSLSRVQGDADAAAVTNMIIEQMQ